MIVDISTPETYVFSMDKIMIGMPTEHNKDFIFYIGYYFKQFSYLDIF